MPRTGKPLRVLVDGRALLPISSELGPTGIGVWTLGALAGLSKMAPDWQIDVAIFKGESLDRDALGLAPNVTVRRLNLSRKLHTRLLAARLMPAIERYAGSYDAMLGPVYATWPANRAAELPVIHDLTYLKYPGFVSRKNLIFLRALVRRMVKRASVIITVSGTMKKEIVAELGANADRVKVVPNGVDWERFLEPGPLPEGFPERYLLFVGTLEPRKNLRNVLAAYSLLRRDMNDPPDLVIVGGRGWRESGMPEELSEGVHVPGYVEHSQLTAIYAHAQALVFPSLYEGFGLPLIEAMAAGTAVITSRRGALEEVAAHAAFYVDPEDPADIAVGIRTVLEDDDLRDDLVEKGLRRVRVFSWTSAGISLRDAITRAVSDYRSRR